MKKIYKHFLPFPTRILTFLPHYFIRALFNILKPTKTYNPRPKDTQYLHRNLHRLTYLMRDKIPRNFAHQIHGVFMALT